MNYYILTIGISQAALPYIREELDRIILCTADNTRDAARQLDRYPFSLAVADLHNAKREARVELMAALRRKGHIPVLALMDYKDEEGCISALDMDMDICLPWDMPPRLLAKQIGNALRRYTDYGRYHRPGDDVPFQRGDIFIDPQKRMAYVRGRPVRLRPREFALLLYFMRNPNIVLTADRICERAWGLDYSRNVGQAVHDLRREIETDPANPIYILTEYRAGYRFTAHLSETCDD